MLFDEIKQSDIVVEGDKKVGYNVKVGYSLYLFSYGGGDGILLLLQEEKDFEVVHKLIDRFLCANIMRFLSITGPHYRGVQPYQRRSDRGFRRNRCSCRLLGEFLCISIISSSRSSLLRQF